jgi:hypothetical protein
VVTAPSPYLQREKQLGRLTSETGAADRSCAADGLGLWISSKCEKEIHRVEPGLLRAKLINPCCLSLAQGCSYWAAFSSYDQRPGTTECGKKQSKTEWRKYTRQREPIHAWWVSVRSKHNLDPTLIEWMAVKLLCVYGNSWRVCKSPPQSWFSLMKNQVSSVWWGSGYDMDFRGVRSSCFPHILPQLTSHKCLQFCI